MLNLAPAASDTAEADTLDNTADSLDALADSARVFAVALRRMAVAVRTRGAAQARTEREAVEDAGYTYIVCHAAVTAAFRAGQRLLFAPVND